MSLSAPDRAGRTRQRLGAMRRLAYRGRAALDMACTWLELRIKAPALRAPLSFREREFYLQLEPYLDCLRIAQNEEFVDATTPLKPGAILAVIPPVAGG